MCIFYSCKSSKSTCTFMILVAFSWATRSHGFASSMIGEYCTTPMVSLRLNLPPTSPNLHTVWTLRPACRQTGSSLAYIYLRYVCTPHRNTDCGDRYDGLSCLSHDY